jgi:hypothetical protein
MSEPAWEIETLEPFEWVLHTDELEDANASPTNALPFPSGDPAPGDGGMWIPPQAGADGEWTFIPEHELQEGRRRVSAFMNLTPVFGTAKQLWEAYTGVDVVTGEEVPMWERVLSVIAAFTDGTKVGKWPNAVSDGKDWKVLLTGD